MRKRDQEDLLGAIADLQRAKIKLFRTDFADGPTAAHAAALELSKIVERLIALAVAAAPVGAMSAYPDKLAASEAPLFPRRWTPLDDEDWTGSNLMGG